MLRRTSLRIAFTEGENSEKNAINTQLLKKENIHKAMVFFLGAF